MDDYLAQLIISLLAVYGMLVLAKKFNHWLFLKSLGQVCPSLSWVMLTKNQERQIEGVVRQLSAICKENDCIRDLVFVDRGSHDATFAILQRLSRYNRDFTVLQETAGQGLEDAVEACRGHAICVLDLTKIQPGEVPGFILALSCSTKSPEFISQISRNSVKIWRKG